MPKSNLGASFFGRIKRRFLKPLSAFFNSAAEAIPCWTAAKQKYRVMQSQKSGRASPGIRFKTKSFIGQGASARISSVRILSLASRSKSLVAKLTVSNFG